MINNMQSYIRANHWWAFKAAPILGFTYLYCYFFDFPFTDISLITLLSAITILGIAGIGYVINDIYDLEADRKAGKNNPFEKKSFWFKAFVLTILSVIAILPWFFLRSNITIKIMLAFQLFLFIVYAHTWTRWKEKSILGPVCDALYGHAVPIIIACLTYEQYLGITIVYNGLWFFTALFTWQFFKGLRNILLHQLEDFENDMHAGIHTLTTDKGKDFIYQKILYIILPIEILSLVLFLLSIPVSTPHLFIYFLCFIVLYIYGHGIFRNVIWHPKVYSKNTYLYFLNNFYETYLPYFFIILCSTKSLYFLILLVIHLFLFPSTASMVFKDFKMALMEFWVQIKRTIYPLYKFLQKEDI